MTVIPDSIEPYIGWKVLRIRTDGRLASPQQGTVWPAGHRFEAACERTDIYGWVASQNPPTHHVTTEIGGAVTYTTSIVVASIIGDPFELPSPPELILPPGWSWDWQPKPHSPAADDCYCGIYAVSHIEHAAHYAGSDCVYCRVALWGNVVVADRGARGQYAYPQEMLIPDHLADVAPLVADLYQIPHSLYSTHGSPSPPGQTETKTVEQHRDQIRQEARYASVAMAITATPLWLVALCFLLFVGTTPALIAGGLALFVTFFCVYAFIASLDTT